MAENKEEDKVLRHLKDAEAHLQRAEAEERRAREEEHRAQEEVHEALEEFEAADDLITIVVDGVGHRVRRGGWIVSELKAKLGIDPAKVLAEITPQGLKDLDDNAEIELHDKEQFMTHARSGGSFVMEAAAQPKSSGAAAVPSELAPIAALCSGRVQYMSEGERRYIYMEALHFLVQGAEKRMDALLCLNYPNDTYPTKLFLPSNLGLGLNWNETAYVLGRPWFSWSWKGVSPNQTSFAILGGHLEAFR